jgi:hypothetical protein
MSSESNEPYTDVLGAFPTKATKNPPLSIEFVNRNTCCLYGDNCSHFYRYSPSPRSEPIVIDVPVEKNSTKSQL